MRTYESTFILSPQADDAAFDQQIKAITDLIGNNDGKIIQEDRWGVRRMAFPIQKFTQGYYTRLVFEGTNKVLSELERFYKLEEPYIRYLTVVCEGDPHEKIFGDAVESAPSDKHADRKDKPAPAKEAEAPKAETAEPVAKEETPKEETPAPKPVSDDKPEETKE